MNIQSTFGVLAAGLAVCSCTAIASTTQVPETLRPPQGQVLSLELLASGVQVYECAASKTDSTRWEWTFKGPEAELRDRSGRYAGKHYGGPTWEAPDGSLVVAEVAARANAPAADAIPLLLLRARTTKGEGAFAAVKSIQRLETAGGQAPAQPCAPSQSPAMARVPYTATYYFYVQG